jgi:superoxide dismutase
MTTVDAYLSKLSSIVNAYHLDTASCQLKQKEKDDLWAVCCDSIRTHKDSKHQTVVRKYQSQLNKLAKQLKESGFKTWENVSLDIAKFAEKHLFFIKTIAQEHPEWWAELNPGKPEIRRGRSDISVSTISTTVTERSEKPKSVKLPRTEPTLGKSPEIDV